MGKGRVPGPQCKSKGSGNIDKGTLCRQQSPTPGTLGSADQPSSFKIALKKHSYLAYARGVSYAMQGKSAGEEALNTFDRALDWVEEATGIGGGGKHAPPRRVQSFLGGVFLRMYLDHEVDPQGVKEAGEEIAASEEFKTLAADLAKHLDYTLDRSYAREPTEVDFTQQAARHLGRKRQKGVAFRRTLNAVIGGVSGIDVGAVRFVKKDAGSDGVAIEYEVPVTFKDTYDFDNVRYGEYDRYRKRLADLLLQNRFDEFDAIYEREVKFFDGASKKTKLDNAAVFASFMYALEKKGWTPGPLSWEVTVPMHGRVTYKRRGSQRGQKRER